MIESLCPPRALGLIGALLLSALVTSIALGQSPAPADSSRLASTARVESPQAPAPASLWTRSRLTGDWWGSRSYLADRGVAVDLRYTSSLQGLVAGTGDKAFDYGGKADAFINLDSGKMGLWKGGGFRTHIEYRHGDAFPLLGGALFAVNTAQLWPVGAPEELHATSLYFTQKMGDRFDFAIGKVNPVDLLAADHFFGGWGIDRFMNLIFVAPPSGLVPPVFMGAVAAIKTAPISWSILVFDPNDRTTDYFPGDLFADGVNASVTGAHDATLGGRKTTYAVTANYSTAEGTDFSALPPNLTTSTKQGSYNVALQFTHDLQESSERPDASWGFYLKAAIADGNPNYVKASVIGVLGGRALFFGRPQDSFGLGAFYYDLSDELQDSQAPSVDFHNEAAVETFYTFGVLQWLQVSANVQYIDPAKGTNDNALVPALRTQIRF